MSKKYDAEVVESDFNNIICGKCKVKLEIGEVKLEYLGSGFPVKLPKCPICKSVYVPEFLALGKMLHVEKSLEDK